MTFWGQLVGALLSVVAVWLTAIRHSGCWPIGILSVLVYAWVFFVSRLYSDALLQLIFGLMIVYGWVNWARHPAADGRVRICAAAARAPHCT